MPKMWRSTVEAVRGSDGASWRRADSSHKSGADGTRNDTNRAKTEIFEQDSRCSRVAFIYCHVPSNCPSIASPP